jgi:RNA polymerase sigma-70 factor (ECF subfamily)
MPDPTPGTAQLHAWLDRIGGGDLSARDELLRGLCERLRCLAARMLRRFPGVARWAQTDDVLQNSLLRLMRALETVRPGGMREFFGLAAEQMRRELLDMARHFYGPRGLGANHASERRPGEPRGLAPEAADGTGDADDLARWSAFHEQVASLPADEREVVGLIFYHGRTQADAAAVLGVAVRTVQRRWQSALLNLQGILGDAKAGPRRAGPDADRQRG